MARHLGDAVVLLDDRSTARAYYAQAVEAAAKIRHRPEVALAHLSLAELLLEEGESAASSEALEHLDLAIPELLDMQMHPALERAQVLRNKYRVTAGRLPARSPASETLTAREREVASLIAGGLSNREIADRLVISEGTAEVHVKHILSKLAFKSRSQVAGWFGCQHNEGPRVDDRT